MMQAKGTPPGSNPGSPSRFTSTTSQASSISTSSASASNTIQHDPISIGGDFTLVKSKKYYGDCQCEWKNEFFIRGQLLLGISKVKNSDFALFLNEMLFSSLEQKSKEFTKYKKSSDQFSFINLDNESILILVEEIKSFLIDEGYGATNLFKLLMFTNKQTKYVVQEAIRTIGYDNLTDEEIRGLALAQLKIRTERSLGVCGNIIFEQQYANTNIEPRKIIFYNDLTDKVDESILSDENRFFEIHVFYSNNSAYSSSEFQLHCRNLSIDLKDKIARCIIDVLKYKNCHFTNSLANQNSVLSVTNIRFTQIKRIIQRLSEIETHSNSTFDDINFIMLLKKQFILEKIDVYKMKILDQEFWNTKSQDGKMLSFYAADQKSSFLEITLNGTITLNFKFKDVSLQQHINDFILQNNTGWLATESDAYFNVTGIKRGNEHLNILNTLLSNLRKIRIAANYSLPYKNFLSLLRQSHSNIFAQMPSFVTNWPKSKPEWMIINHDSDRINEKMAIYAPILIEKCITWVCLKKEEQVIEIGVDIEQKLYLAFSLKNQEEIQSLRNIFTDVKFRFYAIDSECLIPELTFDNLLTIMESCINYNASCENSSPGFFSAKQKLSIDFTETQSVIINNISRNMFDRISPATASADASAEASAAVVSHQKK